MSTMNHPSSASTMEGAFCLERESALGGLFQQIINEMKNTAPYWDDFLTKSSKLHSCLRATIQAVSAFLEAFQKIADAATSTRGATKEIGTALTRICLRHKAMEAKLKSFTSSIMDCLVIPLQKRLEEWNKTTGNLDKEYGKEYKRARAELKKRTIETLRLQKKLRKGGLHNGALASSFHGTLPRSHGGSGLIQSTLPHNGSDASHHGLSSGGLNRTLETSIRDQTEKRQILEDVGKQALRAALTEERSRFCLFVSYLKPVVEEEVAMLYELQHVQEAMSQLEKNAAEPYMLPPASEQVIADTKGETGAWSFQTPPSSPSSLGSRKSSMCSISSANSSSSSSAHSPSHNVHNRTLHHQPMSIPSGSMRFSSVSSQDSGFVSQDTLYSHSRMSTPLHDPLAKVNNQSEGSNTSSTASSNSSTPSSPYPPGQIPTTNSTWPNLQETIQFERAATAIMSDRPHTISSSYERGHQRPPLTVYTFQPPSDGNSHSSSPVTPTVESQTQSTQGKIYQAASEIYGILRGKTDAKPPVPKRGSSLERPGGSNHSHTVSTTSAIPKPPRKVNNSRDHNQPEVVKHVPNVPDFNQSSDDMIVPQPVYVNMHELNQMASAKLQRQADELPPPPPELMTPQSTAKTDAMNHPCTGLDGGIYNARDADDTHSIAPSDQTLEGQSPIYQPLGVNNGTMSRRNSYGHQEKPAPPRRNSSISSSARSSPVPPNMAYNNGHQSNPTMSHSQSTLDNHLSDHSTLLKNGGSSQTPQPIFIKNPQYGYVSVSSTTSSSVGSQGSFDSGETTPHASMESLPPPPAYLINEQTASALADELSKRLSVAETVRTLTEKNHQPVSPNMVRRSNSMKQPGEETRESRSHSNGRRGSASTLESSKQRANLMQVLNQKLAQHQAPFGSHGMSPVVSQQQPQMQQIYQQTQTSIAQQQPIYSQVYQPQPIYQQVTTSAYGNGNPTNNGSPRHHQPRRFSEDLLKTTASFVQNRVLGNKGPAAVTPKEIFVQTLNAKLSQMRQGPAEKKVSAQPPQSHGHSQSMNGRSASYTSKHTNSKGNSASEISRAFRVRQWISSKTVSDPAACRDSLMDQIRRGKKLRTTRSMNDRSAPRIH